MIGCAVYLGLGVGIALFTIAFLLGLGMVWVYRDNRVEDLVGPRGRERLP